MNNAVINVNARRRQCKGRQIADLHAAATSVRLSKSVVAARILAGYFLSRHGSGWLCARSKAFVHFSTASASVIQDLLELQNRDLFPPSQNISQST